MKKSRTLCIAIMLLMSFALTGCKNEPEVTTTPEATEEPDKTPETTETSDKASDTTEAPDKTAEADVETPQEEQSKLSGKCGKNATWVYDPDTETITISGKGKVDTKINSDEVEEKARKLIIEKGITKIDIELVHDHEESKINEITILGNIKSRDSFMNEGITATLNLAGFCRPMGMMSPYNDLTINLMEGNKKYIKQNEFILSPDKKILYLYTGSKAGKIKIPDTVEVVEEGAVSGADNIKMGKNIKKIKRWGFYYCSFKTLKLPENLERIEAGAFSRADIDELVINKKLQYIGEGAFDDNRIPSVTIDHDFTIENGNFPGTLLNFTGNAKKKTILDRAYYRDRKKKADQLKIFFLRVSGANGYEIKITQPGRNVKKIFDTNSKSVKFSDEDYYWLTAVINQDFEVKQDGLTKNGRQKYKKGYALYVSVRPYEEKNGTRIYGVWSAKKKFFKTDFLF